MGRVTASVLLYQVLSLCLADQKDGGVCCDGVIIRHSLVATSSEIFWWWKICVHNPAPELIVRWGRQMNNIVVMMRVECNEQ